MSSLISTLTTDDAGILADVAPGLLWQLPGLPPATELDDGGGTGWTGFAVGKVREWCASLRVPAHIAGRHSEWWACYDPLGRAGEYTVAEAVLAGVSSLAIVSAATPGGCLPMLQELDDGSLGWTGDDALTARVWARQWLAGHDTKGDDDE